MRFSRKSRLSPSVGADAGYAIRRDGDLLRASVWGRKTDDPPSHVCKAILEESRKRGLNRILVELSQKKPLSGASQYLLVETLPRLGLTYDHRVALVHHTPGLYEANDMIDLVAENRGLNVRRFRDVRSAIDWLRPSSTIPVRNEVPG